MAKNKCKVCQHQALSYDDLKSHWRANHPKQYVAVQTWLADVDEAVVVADIVAKEGMKGAWAGHDLFSVPRAKRK